MNIVIPVDHPQYQSIMRGTLARLAGQPELTEAELAERRKQYDNMRECLARLHAENEKEL